MSGGDIEDEIDGLYQLPLAEFTSARNALAARLKASADRVSAERARALVKPSVPAWAVNQVYWKARPVFDALSAAARRLTLQQQGAGPSPGAELREAMKERREALTRALKAAEGFLGAGGAAVNPATLHRVASTLEAVAAQVREGAEVRPGRLTEELVPPGFEALDGAPSPPLAGPSGGTSPAPRSDAAPPAGQGQFARARAEAEVAARRRTAEAAASAAAECRLRAEAARTAHAEAERRHTEVSARAREADEAAALASAALAEAERALARLRD